jgi:virulence factor Mce-like protein
MSRDRARTRRRRSERPRPLRLLVAGLLVTAVGATFVAAGIKASSGLPGIPSTTIYAELPDVGNLKPHDEVRIAGSRVGQVLSTTTRGASARLRLRLDGSVGMLPVDTTGVVRARGLLGTRYLELRPGSSTRALRAGETVHGAGMSVTSGVPDVLNTFDTETRGGLTQMIDGLGESLAGRGTDVNRMIAHAPALGADLRVVGSTVLRRGDAARVLLPSLRAGFTALDGARDDIAAGFGPAADGLAPFTHARRDVQATLDEAGPTLAAVPSGLGAGRRVLTAVQRLAVAVNASLPDAPAALGKTASVIAGSGPALRQTRSLLASVRPTVPAVLKVTRALSPDLTPLKYALTATLPLLDQAKLHACDIRNFADNWRSALGYGTPAHNDVGGDLGPLNEFRIQLISGPNVLSGLTPEIVPFSDPEHYIPACRDSPGGTWSLAGVDTGTSPGRSR